MDSMNSIFYFWSLFSRSRYYIFNDYLSNSITYN